MSYNLEKYNLTKLREIGQELDLRPRRSKSSMIQDITSAFREYEEYKREKVDRYKRIKQLGNKGKEGTTYLVETKKGEKFAMKTFRKTKSSTTLKKEYKLQKKAGKAGISPMVHSYDYVSKYILMDVMDKHLLDVMVEQKGTLKKTQQKRILEIFQTLDKIGVFHGDANLTNYMIKKDIYIIDFGFAKVIDDKLCKKLGTKTPNMDLMLIGFILKLKEHNCPSTSYKYLLPHVSKENKLKFGF